MEQKKRTEKCLIALILCFGRAKLEKKFKSASQTFVI